MSVLAIVLLIIIWYGWEGGFSHEQWPERRKFFRTLGYIFCGFIVYLALLVLFIATTEAAERATIKNANGQTIGRSSTDARGNTTFYDGMGRTTGRSAPSYGGTTFYDNMGRQTGSIRK